MSSLALCAQTMGDTARYLGQRVAGMEFRSSVGDIPPADRELFRNSLPLKRDDTLTRAKLRSTLQALFETKRFSEIQAEATPVADGVVLIFSTKPNYFIGSMQVTS